MIHCTRSAASALRLVPKRNCFKILHINKLERICTACWDMTSLDWRTCWPCIDRCLVLRLTASQAVGASQRATLICRYSSARPAPFIVLADEMNKKMCDGLHPGVPLSPISPDPMHPCDGRLCIEWLILNDSSLEHYRTRAATYGSVVSSLYPSLQCSQHSLCSVTRNNHLTSSV